MRDYLQETSQIGRWVGTALSAIAALLSSAVLALAISAVARGSDIRGNGTTFAMIVLLFGSIAIYTSCMCVQLVRGRMSANRTTVVPAWMIQAFGVFFLAGLSWVAYSQSTPLLAVKGGLVALAMVLVGRNIRARQQRLLEAGKVDARVPPSSARDRERHDYKPTGPRSVE